MAKRLRPTRRVRQVRDFRHSGLHLVATFVSVDAMALPPRSRKQWVQKYAELQLQQPHALLSLRLRTRLRRTQVYFASSCAHMTSMSV